MCEISECPICMDMIEVSKNCVTTECGHKFHTSCLMKNVSFNGFECPYCRSVMAEEDEEDEEYEEEDGEENDEDEENDGEDDGEDDEDDENYPSSEEDPIPSFELIFKKLMDKNVTYEQLVKSVMYGHFAFSFTDKYDEYKKFAEIVDDEIYNTIIKYKPEEEKLVEKSNYNFYFLENEYKERKLQEHIEQSIEKLIVTVDDV